jgi:hypothetical protein
MCIRIRARLPIDTYVDLHDATPFLHLTSRFLAFVFRHKFCSIRFGSTRERVLFCKPIRHHMVPNASITTMPELDLMPHTIEGKCKNAQNLRVRYGLDDRIVPDGHHDNSGRGAHWPLDGTLS